MGLTQQDVTQKEKKKKRERGVSHPLEEAEEGIECREARPLTSLPGGNVGSEKATGVPAWGAPGSGCVSVCIVRKTCFLLEYLHLEGRVVFISSQRDPLCSGTWQPLDKCVVTEMCHVSPSFSSSHPLENKPKAQNKFILFPHRYLAHCPSYLFKAGLFSKSNEWPCQVLSSFKRINGLEGKSLNIFQTTEITTLPDFTGHPGKCCWALRHLRCGHFIIIVPTLGQIFKTRRASVR